MASRKLGPSNRPHQSPTRGDLDLGKPRLAILPRSPCANRLLFLSRQGFRVIRVHRGLYLNKNARGVSASFDVGCSRALGVVIAGKALGLKIFDDVAFSEVSNFCRLHKAGECCCPMERSSGSNPKKKFIGVAWSPILPRRTANLIFPTWKSQNRISRHLSCTPGHPPFPATLPSSRIKMASQSDGFPRSR